MARFPNKTDFVQQLKDERERLIAAIRDIVKDAEVSPEIQRNLSTTALRNNLLLIVALGESQYFWLCYWTDRQGGIRAYDEDDFPRLRECNPSTSNEEMDDIVGPPDSRLLYAERIKRRWLDQEYYSAAAEPVARNLVQLLTEQAQEQALQDAVRSQADQKGRAESPQVVSWLKDQWSTLVAILVAVFSVFLGPFLRDVEIGLYATLAALAISLLWLVWKIAPFSRLVSIIVSVVILAGAAGYGYFLYEWSQPRFEITALGTLEGDHNAYELTDMLIWNQDNLDEYGVAVTFTLEIRPNYQGTRRFGSVVALISGDGDSAIEKSLWSDFTILTR